MYQLSNCIFYWQSNNNRGEGWSDILICRFVLPQHFFLIRFSVHKMKTYKGHFGLNFGSIQLSFHLFSLVAVGNPDFELKAWTFVSAISFPFCRCVVFSVLCSWWSENIEIKLTNRHISGQHRIYVILGTSISKSTYFRELSALNDTKIHPILSWGRFSSHPDASWAQASSLAAPALSRWFCHNVMNQQNDCNKNRLWQRGVTLAVTGSELNMSPKYTHTNPFHLTLKGQTVRRHVFRL